MELPTELIKVLSAVALIFAVYLLPTVVAGSRKHHNWAAIFVLSLFLGWTLLGRVLALVWACTATADRPATK